VCLCFLLQRCSTFYTLHVVGRFKNCNSGTVKTKLNFLNELCFAVICTHLHILHWLSMEVPIIETAHSTQPTVMSDWLENAFLLNLV
jgi:hypothetical protein